MNTDIWEKIERHLGNDREDLISIGASDPEIQEAERELKVKFVPLYKEVLKKYGAIGINAYDIHGLKYLPLMDKNNWTVVQKTTFYKDFQKWPDIEDWYVISDDGRGNPIGIDPEGKVWLSDHDAGFEKVKLADNFEEFLHKLLTDTLYE